MKINKAIPVRKQRRTFSLSPVVEKYKLQQRGKKAFIQQIIGLISDELLQPLNITSLK